MVNSVTGQDTHEFTSGVVVTLHCVRGSFFVNGPANHPPLYIWPVFASNEPYCISREHDTIDTTFADRSDSAIAIAAATAVFS